MADPDDARQPPARLRGLVTWQVSKASTLGARLTARRLPLGARTDFAVLRLWRSTERSARRI